MDISIEQKIIIAASRLTDDSISDNIIALINKEINWSEIIHYAAKNRVLLLLNHNFAAYGFQKYIPAYYRRLLNDSMYSNYVMNNERLSELKKIKVQMKQKGVLFAPVKGAYLIDNVYKNRCIRMTNDIDVLIRRRDVSILENIMKENGYILGHYDNITGNITVPERKEKMIYKTKMYNLLPFIKLSDIVPKTAIIFDFSFALDFSLDITPVDEMLESSISTDSGIELLPEHFFIHMCCHHYREASNVAWILLGKDLNLIKFCDVREFILQKMNSESINKAVQFAKKHKLEKAVYFTVYFTREIYNDGYETEILQSLNMEDETFLYQFGENDSNELQMRKKDFWTSLFSDHNRDEIKEPPKYEILI